MKTLTENIDKLNIEVLVGNGRVKSLVEATNDLFKLHFPQFCDLNESSENVQVFVPEYFLTSPKSYKNLRPGKEETRVDEFEKYAAENPGEKEPFKKELSTVYNAKDSYKGDGTEMDLYDGLKTYLARRKDICVVFFGHNLHEIDITQHGNVFREAEKDCILVNLTYRYIMVFEAKHTLGRG